MELVAAGLAIKLLAYWIWCAAGLRSFDRDRSPRWPRASSLAAARVALGVTTGWMLMWTLTTLAPRPGRLGVSLLAFFPALLVARWFEWALISNLVARRPLWSLFAGRLRLQLWRAGGVAVSSLADAAIILLVGWLGWVPC